ncbi:hypothetical protein K443DRAFT_340696 [Laccaria amethystina LaAM-08-1]|uniref:Uncharacterized protein n=1 Tax=Laccaria amethystina LaAM-08-1 TaxID=1095629 RepID=A0A0C9WT10_9AGAR|nr:hypothetical protein K443DRAFT_340696 [Laccaria amethystina LaAM-08-1]
MRTSIPSHLPFYHPAIQTKSPHESFTETIDRSSLHKFRWSPLPSKSRRRSPTQKSEWAEDTANTGILGLPCRIQTSARDARLMSGLRRSGSRISTIRLRVVLKAEVVKGYEP